MAGSSWAARAQHGGLPVTAGHLVSKKHFEEVVVREVLGGGQGEALGQSVE